MNKIKLYFSLTKPRVIELLLVSSIPTLFYFANEIPDLKTIIGVLLGGFAGAGAANGLNSIIERKQDAQMVRTRHRPVAKKLISVKNALIFVISLSIFSFIITYLFVNLYSAILIFIAELFYIVIYTIWLKPRTTQNIVIGGAAGAIPALVASTAITNSITIQAWLLFLIIFFWTPPHFWSLAAHYKKDYENAHFPMLPVVKGEQRSIIESFIYAILTALTCFWFIAISGLPIIAIILEILITVAFIIFSFMYLFKKIKHMTYFHITNGFLTLIFLSLGLGGLFN